MIVIPMAGMSSRFAKAGYELPKYMLPFSGLTVFDHAVGSFAEYFESEEFLFVSRDIHATGEFIEKRCESLGLRQFRVVMLNGPTEGQAHTVFLGVEACQVNPKTSLTIFNIDTFRSGFRFPRPESVGDGYLEVFEGEGDGWSFVLPERPGSDRVVRTTEKDPISPFCCTGLYHFTRCSDFLRAFATQQALPAHLRQAGELYVAPLYNELIAWSRDIRMRLIVRKEVVFCGVPAEYEALLGK